MKLISVNRNHSVLVLIVCALIASQVLWATSPVGLAQDNLPTTTEIDVTLTVVPAQRVFADALARGDTPLLATLRSVQQHMRVLAQQYQFFDALDEQGISYTMLSISDDGVTIRMTVENETTIDVIRALPEVATVQTLRVFRVLPTAELPPPITTVARDDVPLVNPRPPIVMTVPPRGN